MRDSGICQVCGVGWGAPSAVLAGLLAKTGLCRPRSGEGRAKGGEGALRSLNSGQGGLAAGPGDQDTPDATLGGSLSYAWIRGQEKRLGPEPATRSAWPRRWRASGFFQV